jgi:hypothetical protein
VEYRVKKRKKSKAIVKSPAALIRYEPKKRRDLFHSVLTV